MPVWDFALSEVEVTRAEFDEGVHYALVEECLADAALPTALRSLRRVDRTEFLVPAVRRYLGRYGRCGYSHFPLEDP